MLQLVRERGAFVRLSVVTVCRNDLEGLKATTQSIRLQSCRAYEHVVVDADSSDGSKDYLASLDVTPGFSWRSEPDGGIYDGMNKGLDRITGTFCLFMNAGDVFVDEFVIERIAASQAKFQWHWAYGHSVFDSASRAGRLDRHALTWLAKPRFFGGFGTVPHQATVISTSLLARVGAFRTDVGVSADQELMLRCWLIAPPQQLRFDVANCDNSGVTANQPIGAFARAMSGHRRLNEVRPRSSIFGPTVEGLAVAFDRVKRFRG